MTSPTLSAFSFISLPYSKAATPKTPAITTPISPTFTAAAAPVCDAFAEVADACSLDLVSLVEVAASLVEDARVDLKSTRSEFRNQRR
jgi:hypothetical protein